MKQILLALLTLFSIQACTTDSKDSYSFEGVTFTCVEKLDKVSTNSELFVAAIGDDFALTLGKNNEDLSQTASVLIMTVGAEAVKDKWSLDEKWDVAYWTQSFELDYMPKSLSLFFGEYQLDSDTKIQILIMATEEKGYENVAQSIVKSFKPQ